MKLLGVNLDVFTKKDIMKQIEGSTNPLFIANINPEILLYAWHHKEFRDILNGASLKIIDGVGVVIMAMLLYGVKLERFPGADLAEKIMTYAVKTGGKIFLLGGTEQVNQQAILFLNSKFKILNSNIAGLGGEFTESEAINTITRYQPHILFVALGAPKQEQFIYKFLTSNFQILNSILMGIGGTIDFWANQNLRAPRVLQHTGLEWLWRLARQPWRFIRIVKAVVLFPLACLQERFHI